MAEGCNLPTTKDDFKQIQNSLEKGLSTDQRKFASSLLRSIQKNNIKELMLSLNDPENINYQLVNKALVKSFGEGKVSPHHEAKLNKALYTILKDHPNPQGLFEKPPRHRGPGSTSVDHPYEVLSAAALVQKKFNSSTGHTLKIYKTDRLDLGQKSPSTHVLSTVKKNTIESDILINRDRGVLVGADVIGIDAKYSKGTTYDSTNGLTRQLDGIKNSLKDGSLTEFHFVTNVKFSTGFKRMVDDANLDLIANALNNNKSLYNDIKNLTKDEKDTVNAIELIAKLNFEKDREQINNLLKDRVPQIGYCEKVIFE